MRIAANGVGFTRAHELGIAIGLDGSTVHGSRKTIRQLFISGVFEHCWCPSAISSWKDVQRAPTNFGRGSTDSTTPPELFGGG